MTYAETAEFTGSSERLTLNRATILEGKQKMQRAAKRSLGSLRIQKKTKTNSPEMTGRIKFQKKTLETLIDQIGPEDELEANLAAWKNHDGQNDYLTVEVSPRFIRNSLHDVNHKDRTIFDAIETSLEYQH